jgi:hypothetical protein
MPEVDGFRSGALRERNFRRRLYERHSGSALPPGGKRSVEDACR